MMEVPGHGETVSFQLQLLDNGVRGNRVVT